MVFGVSSSPFLLNATVQHHMESFRVTDPVFVDNFLSSIYVDDLVSGSDDVESTFEFYLKAKLRLAAAGFKLRKFLSNSEELRQHIEKAEVSYAEVVDRGPIEEDQSYAKTSLGTQMIEEPDTAKVLGVQWNVGTDELEFDIREIAQVMGSLEPTKRNLVSVAAKFFDPLGVLSPVTILFKMFCQRLCEAKIDWDTTLSDQLLTEWNRLLTVLKEAKKVSVPRCVMFHTYKSARLTGFCDASAKAYAAIVYLKFESQVQTQVVFLSAKTRVAPVHQVTIPRMELLSALLLAKLLTSVHDAIQNLFTLEAPVCYTDSKASLYWIRGTQHQWKQFVENRVTTIHGLVPPKSWHHCPGKDNPADIPSRGMSASVLAETPLWLNGPEWLWQLPDQEQENQEQGVPDDCRTEMKRSDPLHSLITVDTRDPRQGLCQLICSERFGTSRRLFGTTASVLRFANTLLSKLRGCGTPSGLSTPPSVEELSQARILWIKHMQSHLPENKDFPLLRLQLGLYLDDEGIWRCGGRMSNSTLSPSAQNPILLNSTHHLTKLLVLEAHERVLHDGVRETLSELRSQYWLVRGRQVVKKLLHGCVTCRRFEGKHCKGMPPPPLPEYRVSQTRPFQATGIDFAGPLYVRPAGHSGTTKVWLVLYTCCSTRAVHLDLVQDMSAPTFLRSFRRFTARRGTPSLVISDNAKTFKAAADTIKGILDGPEVMRFFTNFRVEWQFNLEKAPWQGGIFERMIQSAKRCLKKAIGRNCLTLDELLTLVVEVEGVLNSRPLTYVYSDETIEPLTPSHLLNGFRILSLPGPFDVNEIDDDYTPEKVTRRANHLARTLEKFWRRWKREYLLELRNFHRAAQPSGMPHSLRVGEIVTIYDDSHPRGMWRLGRIETLIPGTDGIVRGVTVKVTSRSGRPSVIRRPIQHIYPMEVKSSSVPTDNTDAVLNNDRHVTLADKSPTRSLSKRRAALEARDKILGSTLDD